MNGYILSNTVKLQESAWQWNVYLQLRAVSACGQKWKTWTADNILQTSGWYLWCKLVAGKFNLESHGVEVPDGAQGQSPNRGFGERKNLYQIQNFPVLYTAFTVILLLASIPQGGGLGKESCALQKIWNFNAANATFVAF